MKNAGLMKHAMKRTKGIRWDRWRRMVVMQSLQLMVTSGVVRRAEMEPHRHGDHCADIEADQEASSLAMPPAESDEQGWFTRLFHRRTESPFFHVRHNT
jgi:hypothetical protein